MAALPDTVSMAMFCDFENVALGVRDANYEKFDIKPVLERLLLKGSIVLKKAYCDWDRYKGFKAAMHEANFELIEIPHVRQSGKNSADIRLVVDALDLCYTKSHVNTFVIVSGDSDFSPLVSKLRENDKYVIGVGVKQSTSDLLIANCDEFIFYDDLVREIQRSAARRDPKSAQPSPKRSPEEDKRRKDEIDARKSEAVELAVSTYEALVTERGDGGKIWASMLKNAIKRRKPDFNESYYGFRVFGNLLDEAQARGLLEVGRDEKSGAFVARSLSASRAEGPVQEVAVPVAASEEKAEVTIPSEPASAEVAVDAAPAPVSAPTEGKRRGRGGSKRAASAKMKEATAPAVASDASATEVAAPVVPVVEARPVETAAGEPQVAVPDEARPTETRSEKKPASRNRRPRKPKVVPEAAG
ncbi:MAG: NYN domain-containing protein [Propionivibrio sp.]